MQRVQTAEEVEQSGGGCAARCGDRQPEQRRRRYYYATDSCNVNAIKLTIPAIRTPRRDAVLQCKKRFLRSAVSRHVE